MGFIDTIKAKAAADLKTIVLPESEDDRTILAAAKNLEDKTAKPVIIGKEEDILADEEIWDLLRSGREEEAFGMAMSKGGLQ